MARSTVKDNTRTWAIALILLVALVAVGTAVANASPAYTPLTIEQAKAYILTVGPEEIAKEIQKLDWIEHALPSIEVPPSLIAIHGSDAAIAWQAPLKFEIPALPGATIPMPVWSVELKDQKYPGVVPSASRDGYIYAGLIGVALGVTAVLLLKR
jgi:hypothetical protein